MTKKKKFFAQMLLSTVQQQNEMGVMGKSYKVVVLTVYCTIFYLFFA